MQPGGVASTVSGPMRRSAWRITSSVLQPWQPDEPGHEQVLELAHFVVDARGRDVAQRAGRAGLARTPGSPPHRSHLTTLAGALVVDDAAVGAADGAQQAVDALRAVPVDHAAAAVLGERRRRAVLARTSDRRTGGTARARSRARRRRSGCASRRCRPMPPSPARRRSCSRCSRRSASASKAMVAYAAPMMRRPISRSATSARAPPPAARAGSARCTGAEIDAAQDQLPHHARIERDADAEDAERAGCPRARS